MCVRKEERETKESKHFTMEPSILESAIIILSSLEPFPPQAACCNWPLVSGRLPVAPSRCPGRRGCPPADHCLPAHCPARREGEEGRRGEERGGRRGEEGREGREERKGEERGEGGGQSGGRQEKIGKERNGGRELQSNRLSTKDLFAGYCPATDLLTQSPTCTYLSLHPSPALLTAGHPLS